MNKSEGERSEPSYLEVTDFDSDNWLLVLGLSLLSFKGVELGLEVSVGATRVREVDFVLFSGLDFFGFASDVNGVLLHSAAEGLRGKAFFLSRSKIANGCPVNDLESYLESG